MLPSPTSFARACRPSETCAGCRAIPYISTPSQWSISCWMACATRPENNELREKALENAARWTAGKPKDLISEYKMFGD